MKIEKIKTIPKYILARIKKADAQNKLKSNTIPNKIASISRCYIICIYIVRISIGGCEFIYYCVCSNANIFGGI